MSDLDEILSVDLSGTNNTALYMTKLEFFAGLAMVCQTMAWMDVDEDFDQEKMIRSCVGMAKALIEELKKETGE